MMYYIPAAVYCRVLSSAAPLLQSAHAMQQLILFLSYYFFLLKHYIHMYGYNPQYGEFI